MRQPHTSQQLLKFSEGMVASMTDAILAVLYALNEYSAPRSQWGNVDFKVETSLEQFNYRTIKRSLYHLFHQGLINTPHLQTSLLTPAGLAKIHSLIPVYRHTRPWDKNFHLITYDLPNTRTTQRNRLRHLLQTNGCACLQKSVWITPYHPREFLPASVDTPQAHSLIVIAIMDRSMGVGQQDPQTLCERLYSLQKLNQRYQEFIHQANTPKNPHTVAFSYWNILRDDPQLPFELLPQDWAGGTAHRIFHRLTGIS